MFDHKNPVCRLFVAYMLKATHEEYSEEGCDYIVNRFYDHVETFQEYEDAYQRAARRTPLGFAAFFVNAERHYELAEVRRTGQTGQMLYRAEMKAADMPVDYPLFVRKDEQSGLWKMHRKLARGKYELVPQYKNVIGFKSKTRAEKCAIGLEKKASNQ